MADSPAPSPVPAESKRLLSLDALRGFIMFWIIGGDELAAALGKMTDFAPAKFLARQLDHVDWVGLRFYDLIFPTFILIVGVSLVFSLTKEVANGGRARALRRVVVRAGLLVGLSVLYYGGFAQEWPDMRLVGVLSRIGLCYLAASVIFLWFKPRAIAAWAVALLLGYWALMSLVPIRDLRLDRATMIARAEAAGDAAMAEKIRLEPNPSTVRDSAVWAFAEKEFHATTARVSGVFEPGRNLADHVDFQYLPGKKWDGFYDPEGLLSTLPAIATCLIGVLAGLLLRDTSAEARRKVLRLAVAGVALLALGGLWHLQFPVIKKIWTSSFVLVAGGFSLLMLALFYWLIEIRQWRRWSTPFVWFGCNAITIYLVTSLLSGFTPLAERFVGGDIAAFLDTRVTAGFGELVAVVLGIAFAAWFLRFLYQRKIFLRL